MVFLGADHGGYELKQRIKRHLEGRGFEVRDLGTFSTESVDYPDYAFAVAEAVVKEPEAKGIIACTTGVGSCIAANKIKGIRAALSYDVESTQRARADVDANVLCLGGGTLEHDLALKLIDIFLDTPFSQAERHQRRIAKIEAHEG